MGRTVGGNSLRARLLVGVAAAAMAAPVANRALAQDAAKFAPYVEAGGMVGTHSFGDVDIFIETGGISLRCVLQQTGLPQSP